MKKNILFATTGLLATSLFATPTVSDVIVRQQWPWRGQVRVDFLVDGIGSADVKFTFRPFVDGVQRGEIPDAAVTGDKFADRNGLKSVLIDPAYAGNLQSIGSTDSFHIEVDCQELEGKILYKVIDLMKQRGDEDHIRYITDADLTMQDSPWGLYQHNIVPGINSYIWIQPSQGDNDYKRRYLVMRRVRPGTFGMWTTATSTTLTDGYWIGIFELTAAQYDKIAAAPSGGSGNHPLRNVSQNMMRGTDYSWPMDGHKVSSTSWLGRLRAKVGEDGFDLPTEAQWEYACRAESTDNVVYRSDKTITEIGNFGGSCQEVGNRSPNAWGLFDMVGNLWEHVLDWNASSVPGGYDPAGAVNAPDPARRVLRGGCFRSGDSNKKIVARTADSYSEMSGTSDQTGFRLVQNGCW